MKNYDLMIVFKPNFDGEEVNAAIEKLSSIASDFGGKVESVDKSGRKKLAYEIAGFRDGFIANLIVSLPEDKVAEYKRQLRLTDSIIRTMFTVQADKVSA